MKFLKDMNFHRKRVLVRCGFDVPVKEGKVTDDTRIRESLPTLRYILKQEPHQLIIISHQGRPKKLRDKGKSEEEVRNELSLKPVAEKIASALKEQVYIAENYTENVPIEPKIVMFENLRFHEEEEQGDEAFAKRIASYADVFVQDAFAVCHRSHASIAGIPKFLPSCAGKLLEKEIKNLTLENIERPFVAIIGGAKLETKLPLINAFLKKANTILVGGAMIFTLYKAKGFNIGSSLLDESHLEDAKNLIAHHLDRIAIPLDVIIANKFAEDADSKAVVASEIPEDWWGLDIGPKSINYFSEILMKAKTVVWNGPMGVFEWEQFAKGTNAIANVLAKSKAKTIIGGGDSAAAINKLKLKRNFTHISTGGGASMAFLAGDKLPGIEALQGHPGQESNNWHF